MLHHPIFKSTVNMKEWTDNVSLGPGGDGTVYPVFLNWGFAKPRGSGRDSDKK